jgi:hypothetical protein
METTSENTLWQTMDKYTLDDKDQLTSDEWQDFINKYSSIFAQDASRLAKNLFRDYLIIYKKNK